MLDWLFFVVHLWIVLVAILDFFTLGECLVFCNPCFSLIWSVRCYWASVWIWFARLIRWLLFILNAILTIGGFIPSRWCRVGAFVRETWFLLGMFSVVGLSWMVEDPHPTTNCSRIFFRDGVLSCRGCIAKRAHERHSLVPWWKWFLSERLLGNDRDC